MQTEVIQPQIEVPALTTHDRCDGCGAQAYVRVTMLAGDLLFCKHDWEVPGVQDKLRPVAITVHDEIARLDPQPYKDEEEG